MVFWVIKYYKITKGTSHLSFNNINTKIIIFNNKNTILLTSFRLLISAPRFEGSKAEGMLFNCQVDEKNNCTKLNTEKFPNSPNSMF